MAHEKSEVRKELMRLDYLRKRYLRTYLSELGLTLGQGQPRILSHLLQTGGLSQRALADGCSMDVTTLSRTLDRMAEAGWVERLPSPDSRRAFLVVLTEAGREKARAVQRGLDAEDTLLCGTFTGVETEQFLTALRKMQHNLEIGGSYSDCPEQ